MVAAVEGYQGIKTTGKAAPSFKSLTALAVLATVLLLAAEAAPGIAGPFAVLVGLAVVVSKIGAKA